MRAPTLSRALRVEDKLDKPKPQKPVQSLPLRHEPIQPETGHLKQKYTEEKEVKSIEGRAKHLSIWPGAMRGWGPITMHIDRDAGLLLQ